MLLIKHLSSTLSLWAALSSEPSRSTAAILGWPSLSAALWPNLQCSAMLLVLLFVRTPMRSARIGHFFTPHQTQASQGCSAPDRLAQPLLVPRLCQRHGVLQAESRPQVSPPHPTSEGTSEGSSRHPKPRGSSSPRRRLPGEPAPAAGERAPQRDGRTQGSPAPLRLPATTQAWDAAAGQHSERCQAAASPRSASHGLRRKVLHVRSGAAGRPLPEEAPAPTTARSAPLPAPHSQKHRLFRRAP